MNIAQRQNPENISFVFVLFIVLFIYTVSGHNLSFYFLFVIANAVPAGRQEMKQSLD
ncbi:MAG: hypothetical protein PWP52_2236, partial [Bacteroidales bacterium]|nr:hypothetical protein [Bacteroidales bacterium]